MGIYLSYGIGENLSFYEAVDKEAPIEIIWYQPAEVSLVSDLMRSNILDDQQQTNLDDKQSIDPKLRPKQTKASSGPLESII